MARFDECPVFTVTITFFGDERITSTIEDFGESHHHWGYSLAKAVEHATGDHTLNTPRLILAGAIRNLQADSASEVAASGQRYDELWAELMRAADAFEECIEPRTRNVSFSTGKKSPA